MEMDRSDRVPVHARLDRRIRDAFRDLDFRGSGNFRGGDGCLYSDAEVNQSSTSNKIDPRGFPIASSPLVTLEILASRLIPAHDVIVRLRPNRAGHDPHLSTCSTRVRLPNKGSAMNINRTKKKPKAANERT
jgi:hypothetical protein